MYYAQVHLEHGDRKFNPGDAVPDTLPGIDELIEHNSVAVTPPADTVQIDSQGRVLGTVLPNGTVRAEKGISRYDGDFTAEEIDDPKVDTPFLGWHRNEAEHRAQEPNAYDEGSADA